MSFPAPGTNPGDPTIAGTGNGAVVAVDDISFSLAAGTTTDIEESAVGVHVGADATWYFTSRLGAGVLARFATGTKSVSVNGGDSFDLKAGGAQIGVGLRFKF